MQIFKKSKIAIFALVLLIALLTVVATRNYTSARSISLPELQTLLAQPEGLSASLQDGVLLIKNGNETYSMPATQSVVDTVIAKLAINYESSSADNMAEDIAFYAIAVFFVIFIISLLRQQKRTQSLLISNQKESEGANFTEITHSKVRFSDVAGIDDVKSELEEIVEFLRHPNKFKRFGVSMPKGVLLIGPPGVGKTMVAKAVAGEANTPFFYQNGSSFVEMYVGVGAKRVRQLFAKARASAPSIVFIDEIDAIGRARGTSGANEEREATLNQLLTEMDGFEDSNGVIVIAATNRIEMIDGALLRSGRFDRRIYLSMPSLNERAEIIKSYLKDKPHNIQNINDIAKLTVGFSGAALATLVNEAGLCALRNGKALIELSDFNAVARKVLDGKKRVLSYTKAEQAVLAQYQGAKAYAAYWLGVEFERISLIEDRFSEVDAEIYSKSELLSRLKVLCAGNEWVQIALDESYSNARYDLRQASVLASKMVNEYAMASSEIELLNLAQKEIAELLKSGDDSVRKVAEHLSQNESITQGKIRELLQI
ncbi:AAA family ATPase [Campylobacter sp. 19-13652]|uniref:AAA family ATPase n=1 Tax=Campylobacter sp. 19-13652 TaxID=2840180 RepID=UPI001C7824BB|nr:AAA family ATPase [Campylobacter sp. 19-13652]BCX79181.1 ATPase AAA [Campylobacter sp. 19-13652]